MQRGSDPWFPGTTTIHLINNNIAFLQVEKLEHKVFKRHVLITQWANEKAKTRNPSFIIIILYQVSNVFNADQTRKKTAFVPVNFQS